MVAIKLRLSTLKLFPRYNIQSNYIATQKLFCSTSDNDGSTTTKKSGFFDFYKRQEEYLQRTEMKTVGKPQAHESFVSLLKNSKFISMGDPVGKIVVGEIYRVVEADLYIDFGWKFPTVCTAPEKFKQHYVVGTKVKLRIKDLELASKFLGGDHEITLNEADCVLLGLLDRVLCSEQRDHLTNRIHGRNVCESNIEGYSAVSDETIWPIVQSRKDLKKRLLLRIGQLST